MGAPLLVMVLFMVAASRVTSSAVNLAENKPTNQFDDLDGVDRSHYAVDGDRGQMYHEDGCTHTLFNAQDTSNNNWWSVDLESNARVAMVVLYNRGDCCGSRLADFDIVVTKTAPVKGQKLEYTPSDVCFHKDGGLETGAVLTVPCLKRGKYLAVVRSREEPLTLCEVEVYEAPPGYGHRTGDCSGSDIKKVEGPSVGECARECNLLANCKGFMFNDQGTGSYCWLKSGECTTLTYTSTTNYHFFSKIDIELVKSPDGHYQITSLDDAEDYCSNYAPGWKVASYAEMMAAFDLGYEYCSCGWLSDGRAGYVMQEWRTGCGARGYSFCGSRGRYNTYCTSAGKEKQIASF
ncbi:uncharacterized protein LOC135493022 [Lineus longissimus]|uniref:uncharacterized protein LOC135493022 n=1 Tax=Lineus longissimus TaxID=88925 RepID=UPI00315DFE7E